MQKAAVICANGIGDGLLMMISSHHLKSAGWDVVTFHELQEELAPLFPGHAWSRLPPPSSFFNHFSTFDLVLVENDHSSISSLFSELREKGLNVRFFFPRPSKNVKESDFLFNPQISMAKNIALATSSITLSSCSHENGMMLFDGEYRRYPKRVVIHPTSKSEKKNWTQTRFLQLARWLKKEGYMVSFAVSPKERPSWDCVEKEGFELPLFSCLKETALFLFESGYLIGNDSALGHMASNLKIPTLTIAASRKQIQLWRPDWTSGNIATPPFPLPNFKGIGLPFRDRFWPFFVPVSKVQKAFQELVG